MMTYYSININQIRVTHLYYKTSPNKIFLELIPGDALFCIVNSQKGVSSDIFDITVDLIIYSISASSIKKLSLWIILFAADNF